MMGSMRPQDVLTIALVILMIFYEKYSSAGIDKYACVYLNIIIYLIYYIISALSHIIITQIFILISLYLTKFAQNSHCQYSSLISLANG